MKFTSEEFTGTLKANNVTIELDGKVKRMDSVFSE